MNMVKNLFNSKKLQFYIVQLSVATMLMSIAFCDIFSNVDNKLKTYVTSITGLATTCVGFFGVCAFILYVSTSNERTAESAKKWAIRCLVAIVGIILFSSVVNKGFLYKTVEELINIQGSGDNVGMIRSLLAA